MKRTLLWIGFAIFILYFGCKSNSRPISHRNAVINFHSHSRYDTVYLDKDENGYDVTARFHAKEKDSIAKH